jgi:hypothetical protein
MILLLLHQCFALPHSIPQASYQRDGKWEAPKLLRVLPICSLCSSHRNPSCWVGIICTVRVPFGLIVIQKTMDPRETKAFKGKCFAKCNCSKIRLVHLLQSVLNDTSSNKPLPHLWASLYQVIIRVPIVVILIILESNQNLWENDTIATGRLFKWYGDMDLL